MLEVLDFVAQVHYSVDKTILLCEDQMNSKPKRKQISRRHHIVPRFLLAGFTDTGDRTGKLWQFDTDRVSADQGTIGQFAAIKDFYNVRSASGPDDAFEVAYGKREHKAEPIIERMRETGQIRADSGLDTLIGLIAFVDRRGLGSKGVLG